jgi:exopolysaccharide production protein ExoQ
VELKFERIVSALEKPFVVSAFILFSGGLLTLFRIMTGGAQAIADPTQTDPVSQAIFLLMYAITACFVVVRRKRFIQVVTRDGLLWLLVGIALLSVLWSVAPDVTLRRGIALMGTTLLGVYVAMRFDLREQLHLLAWALGIAALASVIFALALPSFGVMSAPPTQGLGGGGNTSLLLPLVDKAEGWRGIYTHKNAFGRTMALSAFVFFLLALRERRYRWVAWTGFGFSVVLLLLSNSVTGLVIFLTILLIVPLYRVTRWPHTVAVPFIVVAALLLGGAALWGVAHEGTVLGLLNRDVTLTGRSDLWPAVIDMIEKRPWLGYGYNAFWQGWEGPSAYILLVAQFDPGSAHSGYLELCLNLGLLGVVVFALGFVRAVVRAVNRARLTKASEGLWPAGYLTYMLLYNLTESAILTRNSITWVLYVTVVLSLSRKTIKAPTGFTSPVSRGSKD